jgi:putative sigma-54 modulation protein
MFASEQCKSFEEAVDQSAESFERILIKRKEKVKHHI